MNKIKSFKSHALVRHCLLVMVSMLCALPSLAREVVVDGVVYEVNKQERTAVVVDFNDELSSTTEIQEYVSGYLVSGIESYVFRDCYNLESITIPASAFNIGENAFECCSDLKTVRFKSKVPPSIDVDAFSGTSDLKVYVPHGTLEVYKAAFYVDNAETIEENQSTLYPQALEMFTPDYTSLIPSNANARQVAAVQNKADYTANDGLIVDASQLSSNAVEPTEGSLAALIDNDRSTFFHTTWTETNTTGDWHYLQVDLRASYKQIVLKYTKRQGNNSGTPVKLHVYATNTPDAAGGWEDLGIQTCTYGYESAQTGILPLSLGNGYRHVRLTVEETADNQKVNGNLFFYWSELHAYHRHCKADALDEAKRSALTTAMAQAKKEMDAGQETGETTDALQDALTDAENFISLNKRKAVDFAKSFYLTAYSDKPMTVPTGMQAAIVLADLALPSDAKVAICGVSLNELAEGATTAIRPATDAPTAPFRAYTLDGRRVNAASQGELKKGFYIINGRKVMVK